MKNYRLQTSLLLFIAGLGGFLYGYDIGIIGAALLYLNKTIQLTASQESLVVAAVLAGGTVSSLVAGLLADFIGRRRLMLLAAVLFVGSVVLIVAAHGFAALFAGRTLQGLSAGMIAVVIPLYLAETLPAGIRGRGTAAFQLLLTIGIMISMAVGDHYARGVGAVETTATAEALRVAQDAAWRGMFRSALYPGFLFFVGALLIAESPRWLLSKGKKAEAKSSLARYRDERTLETEFQEMELSLMPKAKAGDAGTEAGSLMRRRYVVPFFLTCAVLGLTQTTGINSILQFIVKILEQSGLAAAEATAKATHVTAVNVVFTIVGLLLVDKLGRKALLKIGTGGIAAALLVSAVVFWKIEHQSAPAGAGGIVTMCLMVFVASFAVGPGVCVWLALSELMPTRIRSLGMGIGLLINQGISTVIAAMFIPVVKGYGYSAMFAFWAVCTLVYFAVAAWLLPETKGRTLEEIEAHFAGTKK